MIKAIRTLGHKFIPRKPLQRHFMVSANKNRPWLLEKRRAKTSCERLKSGFSFYNPFIYKAVCVDMENINSREFDVVSTTSDAIEIKFKLKLSCKIVNPEPWFTTRRTLNLNADTVYWSTIEDACSRNLVATVHKLTAKHLLFNEFYTQWSDNFDMMSEMCVAIQDGVRHNVNEEIWPDGVQCVDIKINRWPVLPCKNQAQDLKTNFIQMADEIKSSRQRWERIGFAMQKARHWQKPGRHQTVQTFI